MKAGRNGALVLVIGVPLAAVLMGIVTLVLAFGNPDRPVRGALPELDKRSWVESRQAQPASTAADSQQPSAAAPPQHDR